MLGYSVRGRKCITKEGAGMTVKAKTRIVVRRLFRKGFHKIVKAKHYNIYAGIIQGEIVNCHVNKATGFYSFTLHSNTNRFILDND